MILDNYIAHTSGREPALSATTLLHTVNNVWDDIKGHAIEGDMAGKGLFEGNIFQNVNTIVMPDFKGQLNSCPNSTAAATTESFLGRVCQSNIYVTSGAFNRKDTGFLSEFKGLPIARATRAKVARSKARCIGYLVFYITPKDTGAIEEIMSKRSEGYYVVCIPM